MSEEGQRGDQGAQVVQGGRLGGCRHQEDPAPLGAQDQEPLGHSVLREVPGGERDPYHPQQGTAEVLFRFLNNNLIFSSVPAHLAH